MFSFLCFVVLTRWVNISIPDISVGRSEIRKKSIHIHIIDSNENCYSDKTKFRIEKKWIRLPEFYWIDNTLISQYWYYSLFLIMWINCTALLVFMEHAHSTHTYQLGNIMSEWEKNWNTHTHINKIAFWNRGADKSRERNRWKKSRQFIPSDEENE